jgi:hypothetical protein
MARKQAEDYPEIALPSAIEAVLSLRKALGSASFNRKTAAEVLGYASVNGAAGRVLRSLVSYGLLTASGMQYRVSDLAERFIGNDPGAYDEALRHPPIFGRIMDMFGTHPPDRLAYTLAREYGVVEGRAEGVARILMQSLKTVTDVSVATPEPRTEYCLSLPSGVRIFVPSALAPKVLPALGEISERIEAAAAA